MTATGEQAAATVPAGLWQQRDFVTLFGAATLARLGSEMFSVAVVLFVLARTHSAHLAGLAVAAATMPTLVTGPLVGAWLDRSRHRRAIFLGNQVLFVVAMAGYLAVAGHGPDGLLVLLGLVAGLPAPIRMGGFSGLIPTVVPGRLLPQAYGVEAASYNVAGIAGPALAGAVAAALSPSWALVTTGLAGVVSLLVLTNVPIGPVDHAGAPAALGHALREGLRLLVRVPSLRAVTFATTASQAFFGLLVVAYPLLAQDLGHKRALGGLLFSLVAVGALLGSTVWTRLAGRVPGEPVVLGGLLAFGAAMVAVAYAPNLTVALVASALAGTIDGPVLAATLFVRQELSPPRLRTQVFTTAASLKTGAFALGSALAGPAADAFGARGMLLIVAAGQALSLLVGLLARRAG